MNDEGVDGTFGSLTPKEALNSLCSSMLTDQRKEDSKRINPEGRKASAQQVQKEFLEELPD